MDELSSKERNRRFYRRLLKRRPGLKSFYEGQFGDLESKITLETPGAVEGVRDRVLETIVDRERPILFVKGDKFDTENVTILGPEAVELVDRVKNSAGKLLNALPHIGRFDVRNFPGLDYVGTGERWSRLVMPQVLKELM